MLKQAAVVLFVIGFNTIYSQCPKLVWADEFNGNSLNDQFWSVQTGDGCNINLCGWGNNELQFYQAQNAVVSDGTLKISARRESVGGKQYTSARIRTINKVDIKFGRIEARMKMPVGQGLWPAFWMLPTDNVYGGWPMSGEIDIMEYLGHEPNTTHATLHFGNAWPNNQSTTKKYVLPEGGFNNGFFTYALEWTDDKISWYVNGYLYATKTRADVTGRWPFDQRFHFLLNLAVGGNWPGNPNSSTQFPQTFEIDYVRVYNKTGFPYLAGSEKIIQNSTDNVFKIENPEAGSTYEWSLPAGASITEGNGTNTIKVKWGLAGGPVKVKVKGPCGESEFSLPVKAEGALKKKLSLENFDEEALITRGTSSGAFKDNVKNDSKNDINSTELCGEYVRSSTTLFDVLFYSTSAIKDVTPMIKGEEKIYLDLFTTAPKGTQILLQFENSNRATPSNYPSGRNSRFTVTTTKQNEWERLVFNFLDQPDVNTSNTSINNIVLLFAPNSQTGGTYRIDNFDIYDRNLLSNDEALITENLVVYPNPVKNGVVEIKGVENLTNCTIYSSVGIMVKSFTLKEENQIQIIDTKELSKGLYYMTMTNKAGKIYRAPLIVE